MALKDSLCSCDCFYRFLNFVGLIQWVSVQALFWLVSLVPVLFSDVGSFEMGISHSIFLQDWCSGSFGMGVLRFVFFLHLLVITDSPDLMLSLSFSMNLSYNLIKWNYSSSDYHNCPHFYNNLNVWRICVEVAWNHLNLYLTNKDLFKINNWPSSVNEIIIHKIKYRNNMGLGEISENTQYQACTEGKEIINDK